MRLRKEIMILALALILILTLILSTSLSSGSTGPENIHKLEDLNPLLTALIIGFFAVISFIFIRNIYFIIILIIISLITVVGSGLI